MLDGTTAPLPTGLAGNYRIDVSGAYNNLHNVADPSTRATDNWATPEEGYTHDACSLGEGFGDVQVNGSFVNWGDFNAAHAYSHSTTLNGSVNLAVFDGYSQTDVKEAGWYGDNSGSLNYTITYLGL